MLNYRLGRWSGPLAVQTIAWSNVSMTYSIIYYYRFCWQLLQILLDNGDDHLLYILVMLYDMGQEIFRKFFGVEYVEVDIGQNHLLTNFIKTNFPKPKNCKITLKVIGNQITITCSKSDLNSDQDQDLEYHNKVIVLLFYYHRIQSFIKILRLRLGIASKS